MAGVIKRFQSERAALLGPLSPRTDWKGKEEIKASGSKGRALHIHQAGSPGLRTRILQLQVSLKRGSPAHSARAQNTGEASPGRAGPRPQPQCEWCCR